MKILFARLLVLAILQHVSLLTSSDQPHNSFGYTLANCATTHNVKLFECPQCKQGMSLRTWWQSHRNIRCNKQQPHQYLQTELTYHSPSKKAYTAKHSSSISPTLKAFTELCKKMPPTVIIEAGPSYTKRLTFMIDGYGVTYTFVPSTTEEDLPMQEPTSDETPPETSSCPYAAIRTCKETTVELDRATRNLAFDTTMAIQESFLTDPSTFNEHLTAFNALLDPEDFLTAKDFLAYLESVQSALYTHKFDKINQQTTSPSREDRLAQLEEIRKQAVNYRREIKKKLDQKQRKTEKNLKRLQESHR